MNPDDLDLRLQEMEIRIAELEGQMEALLTAIEEKNKEVETQTTVGEDPIRLRLDRWRAEARAKHAQGKRR